MSRIKNTEVQNDNIMKREKSGELRKSEGTK